MLKERHVLLFGNCKGGCGKTTSAFETAFVLSQKKKKVLKIDFDNQCNLTAGCVNIAPEVSNFHNIFNVLLGACPLQDAIVNVRENLDIIPGSRKLLSERFPGSDDKHLLKILINEFVTGYDYIIIDIGPESGSLMFMAMLASDYIVACAPYALYAREGLLQMAVDLKSGRDNYKNFNVRVLGILATNVSTNTTATSFGREQYEEIGEAIGGMQFRTEIHRTLKVDDCKEYKQAINEYAKSSKPAYDYREFVRELETRIRDIEEEEDDE